ncbi:hypothetical protein OHC33_002095 [Knufia fluminis]|uniref:Uncharacterized protein n=1 Tax=Knufia fluminis TaxID=191047 RepID=A0AAN8EIF2_9EURO|nr:hypothetical protein OHC33_002095 [Knufia fluminis]
MRDYDRPDPRRRSASLPRDLTVAGRTNDVSTAGRSRHDFSAHASARVYGNNVISGSAQVHQGDVYNTTYNAHQYSGGGTPSRPDPRSYLSDSAMHLASGIAGGLVVAGLNGLVQRSQRPPAESGLVATGDQWGRRTNIGGPGTTSSIEPYVQYAPSQGSMRPPGTEYAPSSEDLNGWTSPSARWPPLQTRGSEVVQEYRSQLSDDRVTSQYNEYFLPSEGIEPDVIAFLISEFLGKDATCRPARHSDGRRGYNIRCSRPLTVEILQALKEESAKYAREQKNATLKADDDARPGPRLDRREARSGQPERAMYNSLGSTPRDLRDQRDHEARSGQPERARYISLESTPRIPRNQTDPRDPRNPVR